MRQSQDDAGVFSEHGCRTGGNHDDYNPTEGKIAKKRGTESVLYTQQQTTGIINEAKHEIGRADNE
jgi:hypothetical protein